MVFLYFLAASSHLVFDISQVFSCSRKKKYIMNKAKNRVNKCLVTEQSEIKTVVHNKEMVTVLTLTATLLFLPPNSLHAYQK